MVLVQPLERINHEPKVDKVIKARTLGINNAFDGVARRTTRGAHQFDETDSGKKNHICQLLMAYQSGGLAEEELILHQWRRIK